MRGLLLFILILFQVPIMAQQYERINFPRPGKTIAVGQKITLMLAEGDNGRWETHVITKALISIRTNRSKGRLQLEVSLLKQGLARLEAVLIRDNRVERRRYYFFRISPRGTGSKAQQQTNKQGREDPDKDKQPAEDREQFAFARKIHDDGYYGEAARAFRIFRSRFPKSDLIPRAWLFEGQAQFHRKRYRNALEAFLKAAAAGDGDTKSRALLWVGRTHDALGNDEQAVRSFLGALQMGGNPEIDIRARTGLALHYAKKKKYSLARKQFQRLFYLYRNKGKKSLGYLLALYYAAHFYDRYPVTRDLDQAHRHYRSFLKLLPEHINSKNISATTRSLLRRLKRTAGEREQYLRRNFIDYR